MPEARAQDEELMLKAHSWPRIVSAILSPSIRTAKPEQLQSQGFGSSSVF
jgi:hypothetical protein